MARECIVHYQLDDIHFDQTRMKFSKLSIKRRSFVRNRNIDTLQDRFYELCCILITHLVGIGLRLTYSGFYQYNCCVYGKQYR